jgi:hypothetical protein
MAKERKASVAHAKVPGMVKIQAPMQMVRAASSFTGSGLDDAHTCFHRPNLSV